jgi:hypothetical protein
MIRRFFKALDLKDIIYLVIFLTVIFTGFYFIYNQKVKQYQPYSAGDGSELESTIDIFLQKF